MRTISFKTFHAKNKVSRLETVSFSYLWYVVYSLKRYLVCRHLTFEVTPFAIPQCQYTSIRYRGNMKHRNIFLPKISALKGLIFVFMHPVHVLYDVSRERTDWRATYYLQIRALGMLLQMYFSRMSGIPCSSVTNRWFPCFLHCYQKCSLTFCRNVPFYELDFIT
jgi:hypothetical protein